MHCELARARIPIMFSKILQTLNYDLTFCQLQRSHIKEMKSEIIKDENLTTIVPIRSLKV